MDLPQDVYNILQLDETIPDNDTLRFPAVRVALEAVRKFEFLPRPPIEIVSEWGVPITDMVDWLGAFFGFQHGNVQNQREHILLLLANQQMRHRIPSLEADRLDYHVIEDIRKKLLQNYMDWCSFSNLQPVLVLPKRPSRITKWFSFLDKEHSLWFPRGSKRLIDHHRELLYSVLYLLIWGEAANLRFMPECLCFIFHNMAKDLNTIIEINRPFSQEQEYLPFSHGSNGFLEKVIKPIYYAVKGEADAASDGKAPHSSWRNYDDMNEYFWSRNCLTHLAWPLKRSSSYLVTPKRQNWKRGLPPKQHKVGKTGFVEQRSFWNIFRSFDRLWIGLILMLEAMMIIAFHGDGIPWQVLSDRDAQVVLLNVFITWSALRLLQAVLDLGMQYSLMSRETKLVCVRMILKIIVASSWTIIFSVLLTRVQNQRKADRGWSNEANLRLFQFLETVLVFLSPEILATILFLLPWIRNFVEKSEWRIFHILTWWFETRLFVGRGLREGVADNLRYTSFWLVVLSAKFSFSYFLEIRPMVKPTRELLSLKVQSFQWHEFFTNHNRFIVLLFWAPVVLVYLMDLQIWYAIFSSLVGGVVGLSSHIGEIRNLEQLKLRFPFFASAMTFNLMSEEELLEKKVLSPHRLVALFRDMVKRIQLRYGLAKSYKKFDRNSTQTQKFAFLWNKIIHHFREEDLLSNSEKELLEIPEISHSVRVMQWPTVLLSNELLIALGFAQKWQEKTDKRLWKKISKNEYRRCAVIECYDSVKQLVMDILKDNSKDQFIVDGLFRKMEIEFELGTFSEAYKLNELGEVHFRILKLVEILLEVPGPEEIQSVVDALQNLYDVVVRDLQEKDESMWIGDKGSEQDDLLFLNTVKLPKPNDEQFYRRLRRLHTILSTRESMSSTPKNMDARRRLAFFSNSLFMSMPRAPTVERMLAFSVLTPYYNEDVSYTKKQLKSPNDDGVTTLFYLQSVYPDEWKNFLERMNLESGENPDNELWNDKEGKRELRMWASHRGQTLSRTIRGMMYYQKALETLEELEAMAEMRPSTYSGRAGAVSSRRAVSISSRRTSFDFSSSQRSMNSVNTSIPANTPEPIISPEESATKLKFTYVVACQIYGIQKTKRDKKAEEILFLMKHYPRLRVAYVDEKGTGEEKKFYSVLVKYDQELKKEIEIYRIQLPGPLKLGEGKPENQNHALIFTRGNAVQTIDMNQDSYFEEALKVRNLLEEFNRCHGLREPQILGIREHVLTGPVSSVARFMSAQEMSFVTLGQRVMANPLKIRMHYGHPDFFDRLWFLTRGGLSKASKVINISEDIFAGFNCTLRGGNVTHHEYIQVGKGRDVGVNQIALFEAKVSSGNGEQILSRDVYRLSHRLDFFRMLSFYHTSVGFYVNNMIVVLTVYAYLWGRVYLALSGLEDIIAGSLNSKALAASVNQEFLVQLGIFTVLPMIVENCLELGFSNAVWDYIIMQLELCSMFFTFSLGTKCHYFGRTLLHGGAKYRATGRGFVLQREKFAENYRLFARSHFLKGVELIILLIVYEAYGSSSTGTVSYIVSTFACWFLAFTWIMAPFLFNPTGFDWLQTVYDFDDFLNWLWYKGGSLAKSDQSWEVWWNEENDHLRTTDFWGKLMEIILSLRFFLIQYGLVYRLDIADNSKSVLVYFVSWIYVMIMIMLYLFLTFAAEKYAAKRHLWYRGIQSLVAILVALVFVLLIKFTEFDILDFFLSSIAFLPTGWGLLSIFLVLKPFIVNTKMWPLVVALARVYDLAIGVTVIIPLAILSWLPGFQAMQTRMLFNQAFSKGLLISRLVSGKKQTST